MIIAIDGPAGSGKSTTAKAVAKAMEFAHLDTGAMYRAAALSLIKRDLTAADPGAAEALVKADINVSYKNGETVVLLEQDDVTAELRHPDVGRVASQVATIPSLRLKMVDQQVRLIRQLETEYGGVVVEGRDIGTVVAPEAEHKFFMTASVEERAKRRMQQMQAPDDRDSLRNIMREIQERDERDSKRSVAPLVRADDAEVLDTTGISVDDQVQKIVNKINQIN